MDNVISGPWLPTPTPSTARAFRAVCLVEDAIGLLPAGLPRRLLAKAWREADYRLLYPLIVSRSTLRGGEKYARLRRFSCDYS